MSNGGNIRTIKFRKQHFMKPVIIPTIGLWVVFLAMQGYYLLTGGAWHPSFVPLAIFLVFQAVFLLIAVETSFLRLIAGPRRVEAFAWGALAMLPVFILYSQVSLCIDVMKSIHTEQIEE